MISILYPVFSAILQASSFTLDKVILSIRRINYKTYTAISFPLLFLIDLVIFLIIRPPLDMSLFLGRQGLLLAVTIVLIIGTNLFYYRALKDDYLSELQPISLLNEVPILIVTSLLFTDERNFFILIPALVASLAVVWSHWNHHHMVIKKHTLPFLIWLMVAAPIMAVLGKMLLVSWHPVSLELVRDGAMALVLGPIFASSVKKVSSRAWLLLLATNILSACGWILFFTSYKLSGVVYTVLIFSLQPLLVYFASVVFLKEPFVKKKFIGFIIVLISIATAQFLK